MKLLSQPSAGMMQGNLGKPVKLECRVYQRGNSNCNNYNTIAMFIK
jgi:hypothetical protein